MVPTGFITDRKLFLLFTACLAISVISAPIPVAKYGTLENPANPAPLLRGPDGKPVDMSKWPWKRDLDLQPIPLVRRDGAQAPLALQAPSAATKPAADTSKVLPSKTGGDPATSITKGKKAASITKPPQAVIQPPQSAQKPLSPELQPPASDPIIHPLHPHHVRLRPRSLDFVEDTTLARRSQRAQAPLARRTSEGPSSNSDLKVLGPVKYIPWYEKRSQLNTIVDSLERRFWALDALMTLEKRRATEQNDVERRWMLVDEWEELDRRLTDFRKLIDDVIKQNGGYEKKQRKSHRPRDANSATTPGALCQLPGAHCGPTASAASEPAPVPIERRDATNLEQRSWIDLEVDALERRIDNIQELFNKVIQTHGGTGKAQRKSSRPRDADSATTQGALCKLPGAHCEPPAPSTAPVPIARSFIPDEGAIPRDVDLDEYVEDIARRLLHSRSLLDRRSDGLPVLHSANPSFMFESALRDAVHPHGLAPPSLEGSTASFKDQLAAAARERASKASTKSGNA